MNNKITKTRLTQLLSYDLIKIVAIILAAILVWSLLFTMFGDSLEEGQMLNVYSYNVMVTEDEMDKLLNGENSDYKSFDAVEASHHAFGLYSANDTTVAQQFTAWSSVGQLDLFFVSNQGEIVNKYTDEDGKEVEVKTGLYEYYSGYLYNLEKLADDAIAYCKTLGDYTDDGSFDEQKIKKYFNIRKKGDNFLRHGLIEEQMEVDRFEKIWYAANKLKGWLDDPEFDIWKKVTVADEKNNPVDEIRGVDLGKLKNAFKLVTPVGQKTDDGVASADGVVLAVFNNAAHQPDLVYESLTFLVKVVELYY